MRTLSAAVQTEIAKLSDVQSRTGLVLYLDEGTLRFTDHDHDALFLAEAFTARGLVHSPIKTFFENKTDNVTVTLDNTDLVMSSYYFASRFAGKRASLYRFFLARASCALNGDKTKAITTLPYDSLVGTFPASGTAAINGEHFTFTGNTGTSLTGCSARLNDYLDGAVITGSYPIAGDSGVLMFSGFMDTPSVDDAAMTFRIVNVFDRSTSKTPWRIWQSRCNWDFCGTQCGYNSGIKERGTADSGTTTYLTDSTLVGGSSMVGGLIRILDGTNKGQTRYLSAHNTGTGRVTWIAAMPSPCDNTTRYVIECDKSRQSCTGFGNLTKFDGYDEKKRITSYGGVQ